MIQSLSERLKEVNDIIGSCSCDTTPFEHANVIVRFYYYFYENMSVKVSMSGIITIFASII